MNDATTNGSDGERRRMRWMVYWLLIAIAGGLGAASILRVQPLLSANDRSRWCTVRALVDEDTYQIDKIILDPEWDTIDKVRHEVIRVQAFGPRFQVLDQASAASGPVAGPELVA